MYKFKVMKRYLSMAWLSGMFLMIFLLASPSEVLCKSTNVCYSLSETANFNISLINDLLDVPDAPGSNGVRKVVLDAGHGGHDGGCSGRNSQEKHIALDITLRLGQMIKKYHPDVEVIYTRNKDEFVPLHERADIANKNQADLFISIHCNATAKRNSAVGTETYVMGLHRSEDNLQVAKRENSVITKEANYTQNYDGYDPDSDEAHITLSMFQNAFLDQSIALANYMEDAFQNQGERVSRGVKQAGFLVLRNTVMPSVLIEAGFLNHNKEEAFLTSEEGKGRMAHAMYTAFSRYKSEADKAALVITEEPLIQAVAANETASIQEVAIETKKEEPINYVERAKAEIARMKAQQQVGTQPTTPETTIKEKNTGVVAQQSTPPQAPKETGVKKKMDNETPEDVMIKPRDPKLEYVVQLSASSSKLRTGGGKWDRVENVLIRYEKDMYKYQVGELASYEDAARAKSKLKNLGFTDCFIVAYFDDKPISVKDALAMGR